MVAGSDQSGRGKKWNVAKTYEANQTRQQVAEITATDAMTT